MRYSWGKKIFFMAYHLYKRYFEAGEIGALRAYVSPGSLVVDVGANVGFFTLRFAQWVGSDGCVIAIEPEVRNFDELNRRLKSAGVESDVETYQAVADHADGDVCLVINKDHPGDHKIGDEGIAVSALAVDGLVMDQRLSVSLIKIDVQGAEMRVLLGAERCLMRYRPALFIEVDAGALARFGTSPAEIFGFLSNFDYVPHRLLKTGAEVLDEAAVDDLFARYGYVDILFLAVPDNRH
jgi:FkbM family methyltransferase